MLKAYEAYKKGFVNGPLYSAHYTKPYFELNPFLDENPGKTYIPPKEKKYFKGTGVNWYPSSTPKKVQCINFPFLYPFTSQLPM